MADVIINTVFKFKKGLADAWIRNNPVLEKGEPGYELDTHKLKIGDGSKAWVDLPYIGEGMAVTEQQVEEAVAKYLEEHPIQVTTDSSLTKEGTPADAKAVRENCLMTDGSYEIIFCAGDADPSDD